MVILAFAAMPCTGITGVNNRNWGNLTRFDGELSQPKLDFARVGDFAPTFTRFNRNILSDIQESDRQLSAVSRV